jgi:hypothetical protein
MMAPSCGPQEKGVLQGKGLQGQGSAPFGGSDGLAYLGKHGRTVLISTPMGADNLFASLWQKADTGQIKGAAAFHAPTARNPMIDSDFLAAEEAALGPE